MFVKKSANRAWQSNINCHALKTADLHTHKKKVVLFKHITRALENAGENQALLCDGSSLEAVQRMYTAH